MNKIEAFNFKGTEIRVVEKDGQPWFVLKDVCEVLEIGHVTTVRQRLSGDVVSNHPIPDALGRPQETTIINEDGLYDVILESRKPEARAFRKWVTSDVLPSIRKHGMYATDNVIDQILNNPDFGIELLTKLKRERTARVEAERTNAILMHVNKTYTATEIAKELGFKSAMALNKDLEERKLQFKQNETWLLYSKYANAGYVDIKQEVLDNGRVVYHRRWTQMGREWLLKLYNIKSETA